MLLDHVELNVQMLVISFGFMSCTLFWCYSACRVSEDLTNLSNWVSNVLNPTYTVHTPE